MRRRRKDQNGEYNYWQPATDMMTGLVFVLMLIVALLGLFLLSDYTGYKYDETEGVEETTAQETRPDDDGWSWKEYKGNGDHENVGDGAGDGGGSGQEQPIIQTGGGGYGDEGIKSAVFTELVDDETDRIIPDEGVRFELYRTDWGLQNGMGALQILNTYYPEKISYREYETTEEGVFYLPEKIYQGDYFFRELNEPEGYDAAGDTYFNLDKMYDWPDPFVVQIRVSPNKNVIRVQMSDLLSKDPVGGGTFQVRAAEDVATLDGTVRYIAGQLVDTITCDENGYGESKELYLGSYTLEQAGIPHYYAGINEQPEALVEKKNGEDPPIHEIDTEKTKITLKLSDELYQQQPLSGAVFTVTNGTTGVSQTVETDQNGQILLTDLDKNTSYKIRQQQTIEDYQLDPIEYTEDVDAYGRINGENQAEMDLTNRMLRTSVHGTDMILRKDVADIQLSLYDSQDQLIESWVSGESGKMFTNLKEGSYYVLQGDDGEKRYDFTVADTAQVQNWNVTVLTLRGILTLAAGMVGGTVVIILLLFAGITLAGRRKKEDKKKDSEKKR